MPEYRFRSTVRFTVPGRPMGQPRARVSTATGYVRHYDPESSINYKQTVVAAYMQAVNGKPFLLPKGGSRGFCVSIVAHFTPPKSWSKKKKDEAVALFGYRPCVKPDVDNIAKIILDALNGVLWEDDKEVTCLEVEKAYDLEDCVTVSISWEDN